jgi:ASC-1-like (ASCH) protein
MDHVAIMRKSWGLISKIISGKKIIESRWYKNKTAPWGKIKSGDTIYFKNAGEPITLKAGVKKVISFENLNPIKVEKILKNFGKDDGIDRKNMEQYIHLFKDKKYCLLVFLNNTCQIKPFEINKQGFGTMAAWITVKNINKFKI